MPATPPPARPRQMATARATALRLTLIIAVVGGVWAVILSLQAPVLMISPNSADILVHTAIALLFVIMLCGVIYALIYRNHIHLEQVTAELKLSETRYRAIAEMVTDFAYGLTIDADGHITMDWVNEALSGISGYDQSELLGLNTLRSLIHPDDQALFDARQARLAHGERFSGEFRIITKAGDIRWVHDRAQPVMNAEHTRPLYIFGASQDITAQRQAEEARHASEEQLRRVTNSMLDMVSQTNAAGIFQYVSPAHTTVLGYTPEQLLGSSVFGLIHPDDREMALTTYQTALANRTASRAELRLRHAAGHYIWIEVFGNPLYENDQLVGVTYGSRDITARRQYDDARARHARDLTALYETTLAINAEANLPSLLKTIVQYALNLAGASMGGIYLLKPDGQTLELAVNVPDALQRATLHLGEGLSGRVAQTGSALMVPDYSTWEGRAVAFESIRWGRVLAVPLRVRGKLIGTLDVEDSEPGWFEESTVRVIGLLADQAALAIDNRQLYDQTRRDLIERRRVEEQLRDSEARYRELIENVGEGINLADENETVIFANPAAHEMLHLLNGQLIGRNWREFTDAAAFEQIRRQTALRRTGQVSTYEVPVIRADGQTRTFLVTARPRFDRARHYLGSFAVFRDITERVQAETTLAAARNDLARRNEQLTQILEASNIIRSQYDLHRVLDEIVQAAYRSLGFRYIVLNLVDETTNRMYTHSVTAHDVQGRELLDAEYDWREVKQVLQERFRRGQCYFIPQGEFDWEHNFSGPIVTTLSAPMVVDPADDAWHPKDMLMVPIELRSGEVAGLLCPDEPLDGRRPSADTLRLVEIFAAQAAIALETARLFDAERSRREALEAVYHASQQLTRSLDLNTVFNEILSEVVQLVPAANAHIFSYDGQRLQFETARGPVGPLAQPFSEPRPDGLTYTTARSGETTFIEDSANHPLYANTPVSWRPFAIASLPLKNEAQIVGVMNVGFSQPRHFSEVEQTVLVLFAAQAAVAIQNARLHQQVQAYAHQLEDRVAERTAELERQRQRLQTVLDAAGEGIQILDLAGRTEYVNPATERLTGYAASEVLGRPSRFLLDESLTAAPAARDMVRAFRQGEAWQGELVNRRRDGTLYDTAITLTPLTDQTGTLIGFVAVHSDVTRFRELDRLKDQFVSRIGHELRTPVANIKLYLELLERSQPERYPQYMQTLQRETDRLRRLIDGFLEMAQLDAGAIHIRPSLVDLNHLVQDILEDRQSVAADRSLTLNGQLESTLPVINTDRMLIAQALSNLMDNALNYTPSGGRVTLQTALSVKYDTRWVTVSVTDTGPGIAPHERTRLQERFYRGEAARDFKVPGAGLGLSIVEAIMIQLGGRLTIESEPGQGATFTLWLPVG